MITEEEIISVGKFQKTHALKGELNMISQIDLEYYLQGNPLIVEYDGILVPYFVESVRPKGNTSYLVKLKGVDSEEEANIFVNETVYMLKKDADEWIEEDFMDKHELIGYQIFDAETGNNIGTIEDVEDSTVNILLIVKTADNQEIYIPLNEELVKEFLNEEKIIKMLIPDGLLNINN